MFGAHGEFMIDDLMVDGVPCRVPGTGEVGAGSCNKPKIPFCGAVG